MVVPFVLEFWGICQLRFEGVLLASGVSIYLFSYEMLFLRYALMGLGYLHQMLVGPRSIARV
jgi:hypothetical protein